MMNCNILIPNIDDLTYHEWMEVRRSGLGGSDVAAALGMSPWKSTLELWEEKALGKTQPRQESEPMTWGKLLEPVIRDEFARRTGMKVTPCRSMLQAKQWPWMLCTLDGTISDPQRGIGVLEIKTTSAFRQDDWSEDRCPDAYALQVAHYLAVTGLSYAVVVVLVGGNKLQWLTVNRDEELIASLVGLEQHFWQEVLTQTPPPVDGSSACADLLARRYPSSSNSSSLILPAAADEWINDYIQAKADMDAAEERKRLAENRLKEVMGEHERAISPEGRQVSWKSVTSTRIDTAQLKKEEPALYEKLCQASTSRRFSVSMGK